MGTAQDWTRGMAGSQSVCAAWMRASTLAEESSRRALPIQPQVHCAWLLLRGRITTTTPGPLAKSPIALTLHPSARVKAARCWKFTNAAFASVDVPRVTAATMMIG